ncbi:lysophospholipid acyltransferase 5-like [Gigantopelta aegis]|uniref:lysophospholipid acyltransferase 5-like n=1 Tax=Gigantopelta aegis TaxID=1735272 RepID=UPI001B88E4E4|nr:lysophospholipid acyltransferase 5-like [Gigantopelta aegis]
MVLSRITSFLASTIGAEEIAIRLLLSLLAGYPLAFFYRSILHTQSATVKHIFFTISGLLVGYFCFGPQILNLLVNISVIYVIIQLSPGTRLSVFLGFSFNMLYLLIAYFSELTDGSVYKITWTIPHCVLTLRLTGLVFDLYDGHKDERELSADQKKTAIKRVPSFLEMTGHSMFFGGCLVGPQFPMRMYLDFVHKFAKEQEGPPDSVNAGISRFLYGMLYVALFQIGVYFIPTNYMLSDDFMELGYLSRCAYVLIWGKVLITKYIGTWLLAEGSIIITGLSYNGTDENGNALWDGCTNVKLRKLEEASSFRKLIEAFNHNTNSWMSKYIFKRLRFLGNKNLSHCLTLLFLAVWHGVHSGYYMCFFLEFFMSSTEAQITSIMERVPSIARIVNYPHLQFPVFIVCKVFTQYSWSYALISFGLLKWNNWVKVHTSLYFNGHIIFLGWPLVYFLLNKYVIPRKSAVNGIQGTHISEKETKQS